MRVRLTQNIPVGREHGLTEGRVMGVYKREPGRLSISRMGKRNGDTCYPDCPYLDLDAELPQARCKLLKIDLTYHYYWLDRSWLAQCHLKPRGDEIPDDIWVLSDAGEQILLGYHEYELLDDDN